MKGKTGHVELETSLYKTVILPVTPVQGYVFCTRQNRTWRHRTDAAPLEATPGPRLQQKSQGHGIF